MNTRGFRYLMACVAAIIIAAVASLASGCSAHMETKPTPVQDKFKLYSSGQTTDEMTLLATELGLDNLFVPKTAYQAKSPAMIAVGELGAECVVTIYDTGKADQGIVQVVMDTRYRDVALTWILTDANGQSAKQQITEWSKICGQGSPPGKPA